MTDDIMVRVALVESKLERLIEDLEARDQKLDALLELKNKGMGAIWLATIICSASMVGFVTGIISWVRSLNG